MVAEVIWLQCENEYDRVATFAPQTGGLTEYSRRLLGEEQPELASSGPKANKGFYCWTRECEGPERLSGRLVIAVYGLNGRLFLLFGDRLLEIGEGEIIDVSGPREARHLVVSRDGEPVFAGCYSLAEVPGPIPGDFTPFVEEEHFDIGLLASNISRDPERRALYVDR